MSTSRIPSLAFLCGVTLAGCAAVRPQAGFTDVRQLVGERLPQQIYWNQGTAADAEVEQRIDTMLAQELSADTAVQIALLNNRNLQATYEELGIAQADLVQAGLLQNPVFSAERRFSGQAAEFDVLQDFLNVFLIPLRKRAAGAAFEAEKSRVGAAVVQLATDVRAAFYTLQGAEQLVEMRRSVVQSAAASAEAAGALHDAGNITDLDLRSEQKSMVQAKLDLAVAEEQVAEDRERLNTLLGLWGTQTTWTISARLPELPRPEVPQQGLESLAVSHRLDLAAARQDIVRAAQSLGLTSVTRFVPEVIVGTHYEHEPDTVYSVGPSLALAVPLFDQGQAKMARSRSLLRQSQERYLALAIEIRSQVRAAYSHMSAARFRAEYYRGTVLPLHADILQHTQLQYNAMQVGVFQLLVAKQAQIDAGREYIEALREYWVARSELERAVGGRLKGANAGISGLPSPSMPKRDQATPEHQHPQHGDQQ